MLYKAKMINFSRYSFHPVIQLPSDYEIYDFSKGYDPDRPLSSPYGVGRYNEDRPGMYNAGLFNGPEGVRTIHMGIDIGAPIGTEIRAFYKGEIYLRGYNPAAGDYGHTLITKHEFDGEPLYALFGHLSAKSTTQNPPGKKFEAGEPLAWVGDSHENGGWNPHLHIQLCLRAPEKCDMPGVVSAAQRAEALTLYPDPRLVLGPIY